MLDDEGAARVVVGEQGREEVVVDLEAVKVTSQGYTTAQRRQRMLWVSGNRRREAR